MPKVLYISYDGMTDNLGQSQVIPYLKSLTAKGFSFTILSFEKPKNYNKNKNTISKLLHDAKIIWEPRKYTSFPPIISTLVDVFILTKSTKQLQQKEHFDIVHCRSYISALAGLLLKRQYSVKFVFDMRGFWADERVDGKIWNLKNPVFNWIYNYFKSKEEHYLSNADCTISLTDAGKKEIHSWKHLQLNPIPVKVIPCCADFEHFKRTSFQ